MKNNYIVNDFTRAILINIYYFIKFIKKRKSFFLYSIVYILFFESIYLYTLSLKGCFLSFRQCAYYDKLPEYFHLASLLILSCLIFGASISIQIISRLSFINYFIFFISFFGIFYNTQGTDFAHHGTYNSITFILFFPLFSIVIYVIYLTLYFLFNLYIKKFIISILFLLYVVITYISLTNCQLFFIGIGGSKLVNDQKLNDCYIHKPKRCGFNLLSGLFDVNYFRKKGCEGFNDDKRTFMKYFNRKFRKFNNFAYPITAHWNPRRSFRNLADLIERSTFPINKYNLNSSEVFVSFNNNKGKITINLKKNENLIQKKRKIAVNFPVKFENIYVIYLDAISRNNFIRRLKKATKIFEKIIHTNQKREKEFKNYNAFQFFKYHNFNEHTQGNIFPIFYGNKGRSNRGISIVKFLNEKGFITAAAHNSCNRDIFDWFNVNKNIQFSNYDHENVAMFCDTNYEDKKYKWSIKKGKSSILRRCFYGRDSFDYNFEYILQFLEAYKNERKYFRITFGDGHEATTEVIKYIDNSLSNFILKILKNYFNDKTAIIIFSDHGAQMPGPYDILFYEEKITEKYLGLLLLILPNKDNYNSANIIFNEQQMITAYDIHDTLLDMINVNKYDYRNMDLTRGQSLFVKINGKERNCLKYKGEITPDFCFCHKYN